MKEIVASGKFKKDLKRYRGKPEILRKLYEVVCILERESDALMLSVNVTPGSSDGIPSGTYTIIDANTADDYDVNTALSGVYEPTYGGYFGSWYFSTENRIEASVRGGSVTITDNGNDNYTFEIALEDGYGHKITGTYSGSCQVEDWS